MEFESSPIEKLFQSFDWTTAFYDPLHDRTEATSEEEKRDLARMETVIDRVEKLWNGTDTDSGMALIQIET